MAQTDSTSRMSRSVQVPTGSKLRGICLNRDRKLPIFELGGSKGGTLYEKAIRSNSQKQFSSYVQRPAGILALVSD